jgi:hypothetical protein
MGVKKYKPTTPSRRGTSHYDFSEVTKTVPEKSLLVSLKKSGGRNARGRITIRHRGGGHKRKWRIIDFKRNKYDVAAKVTAIEYDPNRTSRIALLEYTDGEKRYIICPNGLKVNDEVMSTQTGAAEIKRRRRRNSKVCRRFGYYHGKRKRFCPHEIAQRRGAFGESGLPGDNRPGRQYRTRCADDRKSRPLQAYGKKALFQRRC